MPCSSSRLPKSTRCPLTIVSRCQRYDFRRLSLEAITNKLAELCMAEEVEAGEDALELIARHSTGSLRDAENLLEQAVVSYGSPLTVDQVSDMLDLSGDEDALDLCEHVVNRNVSEGSVRNQQGRRAGRRPQTASAGGHRISEGRNANVSRGRGPLRIFRLDRSPSQQPVRRG